MAVFYPPNIMSQPTVTDTPFECPEWEGVDDAQLEQMEINDSGVASWEPTLERAIKSIVSIKAQCVRSFDTETSGTYTATGFVVDAKAGLILSNRHVVNPAPIVAQAIFVNYEEVELQPVYRDPIHDFGFFRFDPEKLKFMHLESINLAPHKAKIGMEIRVVGNDAGEKLSILAGTLARLDRTAPEYGVGEYNDFNTFYLQAASGTSGGSSGSPVLDIYGDAVALNAGGSSKAASSFYLPLNRIVRALELVRCGMQVPRGTIQSEFEYLPYDELRRLGLDMEIESKMRETFPQSQGMLTVRTVLPKGPSDGSLQSGDIVVAINGRPTIDFFGLEEAADTSVGKEIKISVWRGGKAYDACIKVQNMHDITPSRFIEVGGGVVNELSYQVARSYGIPVGGVYVASSGHVLGSASAWRGSVILSIGNIPTPNLDSFADAFSRLREGSRVPVRFFALEQPYKQKVTIMNVTTHWHALRMASRDVSTGYWIYRELKTPESPTEPIAPQTASVGRLPKTLAPGDRVWPSIVLLDFHIPYLVDGMKNTQYIGPGIIVDKENGYILCDRDSVPIGVGDIYITIAGSIVLVGNVEFLHPVYNFAIVKYDPKQIGQTPVEDIRFHPGCMSGDENLEQGDAVYLVAVGNDQNPVVRRTEIASRSMVSTRECLPPRFRCINVEAVKLNDQPSCQGGVLCDENGLVKGLWTNVSSQDHNHKDTSVMTGLDVSLLQPTIEALRSGRHPDIRSLDIELWTVKLAAARTLGLSAERIRQVEQSHKDNPKLLYVLGLLTSESPAAKLLRTGDIILEKNGRLVHDVRDVGVIYDEKVVDLVVLREGKEITLHVPTTNLEGMETRRVVHWSGALVQQPYRAVQEQIRQLPSSVYVSCTLYGSPANCYGLRPGMWITEIENRKVKTIDEFIDILKELNLDRPLYAGEDESIGSLEDMKSGRYVRITVVNRNEVTRVLSLRLDNHYWPPWQLVRDPGTASGWKSIHHI
ncbi:trypsin-like serine protease [Martensiomyces pterosporus]|nr:trypsin-like serine protease [Martensiomyces pterosporus]